MKWDVVIRVETVGEDGGDGDCDDDRDDGDNEREEDGVLSGMMKMAIVEDWMDEVLMAE